MERSRTYPNNGNYYECTFMGVLYKWISMLDRSIPPMCSLWALIIAGHGTGYSHLNRPDRVARPPKIFVQKIYVVLLGIEVCHVQYFFSHRICAAASRGRTLKSGVKVRFTARRLERRGQDLWKRTQCSSIHNGLMHQCANR